MGTQSAGVAQVGDSPGSDKLGGDWSPALGRVRPGAAYGVLPEVGLMDATWLQPGVSPSVGEVHSDQDRLLPQARTRHR